MDIGPSQYRFPNRATRFLQLLRSNFVEVGICFQQFSSNHNAHNTACNPFNANSLQIMNEATISSNITSVVSAPKFLASQFSGSATRRAKTGVNDGMWRCWSNNINHLWDDFSRFYNFNNGSNTQFVLQNSLDIMKGDIYDICSIQMNRIKLSNRSDLKSASSLPTDTLHGRLLGLFAKFQSKRP